MRNPKNFLAWKPDCCLGLEYIESTSFWPPFFKDEKTRESTLDFLLKFSEEDIKVASIHYKLSKKTKKLSAFKIQYDQGVKTPVFKAKDETEDDMHIIAFTKKQYITRLFKKRIDRMTLEYQFAD